MRSNGGEPVGDAFINGWQMTNGIDWEAPAAGGEGEGEGAGEGAGEGDKGGEDES
jgi:hypothetical protein